MEWVKRGLVWRPQAGAPERAATHAMGPTPFLLDERTIRVFVTCLDEAGRGRPYFVDVDAADPTRVLRVSPRPLMDLGQPGTFDENGALPLSVMRRGGELHMYYAGFELCTQVRYRIFTGLAISRDGGEIFERASRAPVLDRTDQELYFRCGPFALAEDGRVRLWYVAGDAWTELEGKQMPIYDLRYLESEDGVRFAPRGQLSMALTDPDEHGFGRPWVVRRAPDRYELYYSIRKRSVRAYRLGYAESCDGLHWERKDGEMNLDVSPAGFDSQAIMYSAVVGAGGREFCFYNGNDFGIDGFAVAERVA